MLRRSMNSECWLLFSVSVLAASLLGFRRYVRSNIHRWAIFANCSFTHRLTVVISTSHVWNLLRTKDVHLHTPALRIGTHFLLTLKTVVFLFHLLSTTSKPFSSLSTRLAHAARLGFFYKNALYKFTVIIIIINLACPGSRLWLRKQKTNISVLVLI